jgi:glyoxylase-like metal-dependent hydrolase (beta-lactamase superfamily II)
MAEMHYRVFALRYGSNHRRRRAENVIFRGQGEDHDAPMPMDFFIWAITGPAGPPMCSDFLRRPYDAGQLGEWLTELYRGRVTFHCGDDEIAPGISIHHVGGHTPGMQVVRVSTARGQVVLASDAVHYYENLTEENPFPVLVSTIDYIGALRTVARLADGPDHIVPGHDPLVLSRFPAARPGLADAAALHLEPAEVQVTG